MENTVLASTYCLFRIHKLASFTTHRLEIAGDFIHFFDEDENSVYSLNSIYPVLSFPLNKDVVMIDTKLKRNKKHRGYRRVVFLNTINNMSVELFYNKRYKANFKIFKKAFKNFGHKIINTSIDASEMY